MLALLKNQLKKTRSQPIKANNYLKCLYQRDKNKVLFTTKYGNLLILREFREIVKTSVAPLTSKFVSLALIITIIKKNSLI